MAFTVGLPGGTRDFEFDVSVTMLQQAGKNIADAPRVRDPATGERWLYVWPTEQDAQAFAARLAKRSHRRDWKVYKVGDAETSVGPLGPVVVELWPRSDGVTYALASGSQTLVRFKYPEAHLVTGMFLLADARTDPATIHGPIWDHVALILTGLSAEQLAWLGGYQVYNPDKGRVYGHATTPAAA